MPPKGGICLEQIAVENLGPMGGRTFEMGPFNLVFGRNETGKTYLVEFLLRALFRQAGEWNLRNDVGQGKVRVRGLAAEAVEFTPGGRRKLEDYWSEGEMGLPTNMGRLLVVKGGELDFDRGSAGGVDRAVLKSVLSNENLIDRILKPMQETVKKAEVVDREIKGHDKGELQDRAMARSDLQRIDRLLEQVDTGMPLSRIRSLELMLKNLYNALAVQLAAKRHQAYLFNQALKEANRALEDTPQEELDRLSHLLRDLRRLDGEILQSELDLGKRRAESQHFDWVEQAAGLWQQRPANEDARTPWLILAGAGLSIAVAAGLALFDQSVAAAIAAVAGLAAGAFGLWRLRMTTTQSAEQVDRSELAEGFAERFGEPLTDLAQLKTVENGLRKAATIAEAIEQRRLGQRAERATLAADFTRGLAALTGKELEIHEWEAGLGELAARRRLRVKEAHEIEKQLEGLGVDASDYSEQPAEAGYSKSEAASLEHQLEQVQVEIARSNAELQGLKQSLCNETGDSIDRPWEEILGNLWKLRQDKATEYRQRTGRILAQIGVKEVLARIAAEEDERIRMGLQDRAVRRVLQQTTQHYQSVDLENDSLVVRSETADYQLAALSTGAREQVLLALRMGFASRLAGGQPLFMLLDDAFQHSDWERRERLVAQVLSMVQSGWQITYLTMDDHLRGLFDAAARQTLGEDYRFHPIEA
ncbi:MAG TPA: hypothetical protein VI410_10860 [Anaerolineales bacterium]|nr:hypothetical protein [Anaerolineales bacterium]